jgi:phosphoadenosine phosphosulfate reductase
MSHDVTTLAAELSRTLSISDRIRLVAARVPGRIAFSTSLGLEDQALLHAIAEAGVTIDIFTLDTGRLFPETLDTIAAAEQRYALSIRVVMPEPVDVTALVARDGINGFRLSIDARRSCCEVRKVKPLRRALSGAAAWMTGLRRGQSAGRTAVPLAEHDKAFDILKLNPLADWSLADIEGYVKRHDIPVNPLHARGFPSIGCQPCTRAIAPGEDVRAGRWWWESADGKECGLHNRPKRKEAAP